MNSNVKKLLVSSLLLCLPLLAGCGKSPTAPEDQLVAAPESLLVKVTLVRLLAVADGDGIEGAGDFAFRALVNDGPNPLEVTASPQIETGNTYAINRTKIMRVPKGIGYRVQVKFTATEWDANILGHTYPDTRMDNLTEERMHSETTPSATFNDGERWITLGEGDLQLRLVYTITSSPI